MADTENTVASQHQDNPQETEAATDEATKAQEQTQEEWLDLKKTEKNGATKTLTPAANIDDNNGDLGENSDNKDGRTENKHENLQSNMSVELGRLLEDLHTRLVNLESDNKTLREKIDVLECEHKKEIGTLMERLCNVENWKEKEKIQNKKKDDRNKELEDVVKDIRPHMTNSDGEEEQIQNDKETRRSDGTLHQQEQLKDEEIKTLRKWIHDVPWQSQNAHLQREIDDGRIKELEGELEYVTQERDVLRSSNTKFIQDMEHLRRKNEQLNRDKSELNETYNVLRNESSNTQKALKNARKQLSSTERLLDDARKTHNHMKAELEGKVVSLEKQIDTLTAERDDLKNRYSKLAGHKLTDQNPDIADLSDPNRAMKLSERFGTLYDDEWTNAFEELTDKLGVGKQDAVTFLLRCLQECWNKSQELASDWMAALNNAFLFPIQNPDDAQEFSDVRPGVRLGSKELRAIRDARRLIGPNVAAMVKQICQDEKEKLDACKPYFESCAEICWLMALADPPLHIDFAAHHGDAMDTARYTAYDKTGNTIDYLVWPALYASEGGGLLSKGTAATQRKIERSDNE